MVSSHSSLQGSIFWASTSLSPFEPLKLLRLSCGFKSSFHPNVNPVSDSKNKADPCGSGSAPPIQTQSPIGTRVCRRLVYEIDILQNLTSISWKIGSALTSVTDPAADDALSVLTLECSVRTGSAKQGRVQGISRRRRTNCVFATGGAGTITAIFVA
jgi:hypothetical protein